MNAGEEPGRILVVRAGALGDTLMATPAVRALRNRYPRAEIDFLCSEAAFPLLELNPAIARLFVLHRRKVPFWLSPEKWRLARALQARGHGRAVLLESAPGYRELVERAGIRGISSIVDTFDPAQHSIVNNLRAAGFSGEDPPPMEIHTAPRDEMHADEMLRRFPRPIIGFHAGYGPSRTGIPARLLSQKKEDQGERLRGWGADNFARLAALLKDASIVLTGSGGDLREAERIRARMDREPLVLAGRTTVGELAAVIQRLDLLVSVDSGPAHMAAALATPLVVLWGPGILEQTRPVGDPARIRIIRHRVFCAPCYGTPMMKQCRRNICMEAISPERVAAVAMELLLSVKSGNPLSQ